MSIIIITAIIAFDCGLAFGSWWANCEQRITDQERTKQTARHLLENL